MNNYSFLTQVKDAFIRDYISNNGFGKFWAPQKQLFLV
jgi:hypothetical protein